MKANIEKKYIDTITNCDVERFVITSIKDGKAIDQAVSALVKSVYESFIPTFYRLDVKTGKVKTVTFDFTTFKGIADVRAFVNNVVSYFYAMQQTAVHDLLQKVEKQGVDNLSNVQQIKYDVFMARCKNASEVITAASPCVNVSEAAKNVARVLYGATFAVYPDDVKEAVNATMSELKRLYAMDINDGSMPNVKELRKLVSTVMNSLFPLDDKGIVKRVRRACTDKQARDIFAVYYKGRRISDAGKVAFSEASEKQVLAEIMLICLEAMQVNSPEIVAVTAEKTAVKSKTAAK